MLWLFYNGNTQALFWEETENNRVSSWKRSPRLEIRDMLGGTTPDVNSVGFTGYRRSIPVFVKDTTNRSALETLDGEEGTLKSLLTGESWTATMSGGNELAYEIKGIVAKDGCQYFYRGALEFIRT